MSLQDDLHKLYLVDQQVRGLSSRLDGAQRQVRAQEIKIQTLTEQRDQLSSQLKQIQAQAHNLEQETASIDQRIATLREQMNSASTNKEYSAMLVETNTIKADKSKLEDQTLELMTRVDELNKQVEDLNAQITEQQKLKEVADNQLAERQSEVGDRLAELKLQRDQAASVIPAEPLAVFERLAETLDGEALAPVIETDRRSMTYTCGGCYMTIPVERVNQLISTDQIIRCTSCSRILYLEQELKESMAG